MPQKHCCTCNKPLTTTERSADQIQCTNCYRNWLTNVVPRIEPMLLALVQQIRRKDAA